ncbi:hypothetical protein F4604DRAFT_1586773, partial [Suillus subluteus]
PSQEDICKWTTTEKATAPCFIRDVLSMRERRKSSFYWLGHIPCHTALIVGVVVGIEVSERWTIYTVDDSTAVIQCMLRHPLPYAHLDRKALTSAVLTELRSRPLPPPPPPATDIGYLVQVIGRYVLSAFLTFALPPSEACDSTNDQWKHALAVVQLHKSKYAVPKPFEIPAEVVSDRSESCNSSKRPLPGPSSPLTHSATSGPSGFVVPGSADPPKFRHPSQLRTAELTDTTFQLYLKHYLDYAPAQELEWDFPAELSQSAQTPEVQTARAWTPTPPTGPAGFTLSHLRRIPDLALLASLVVSAETKRRDRASIKKEKARTPSKPVSPNPPRWVSPPHAPREKMKRLFLWAILKLYQEGTVVFCDRPLLNVSGLASLPVFDIPKSTRIANSSMFWSADISSSQPAVPEQDGYLSDPPPYEEDEAYISVTPSLLAGPVRDIIRTKGIRGKSRAIGAEEILGELKQSDVRWACVGLRAVEEAMETIVVD